MKTCVIFTYCFLVFTGFTIAQNINHQNMAGPMGLSVNSFNGNLYFQRTDLFINGRKLPIDLTFNYNSNIYNINLGFGKGWSMPYLSRWKKLANGGIIVMRGDGFQMQFEPVGTDFKAPSGIFDNLQQYETGKFKLTTKERTVYSFDNPAHQRLTRIEEINGNFLTLSYTDTLLTQITDAAGRSIQLNYEKGLLSQVVDALDSPTRTIKYSYDPSGNLLKVQDPLNNSFQYSYLLSGPLNKLVDKNGNAADILYNAGYQVRELITCTRDIRYSYSKTSGTTIMVEQVSGQNQVTKYKYNNKGQITQKTGNCCGFNTSFEYDNDGNTTKFTDANGNVSLFTYDGRGNMLSKTDALGHKLYVTYDEMGNVTSFTDKNGNITGFDLDTRGNVVKARYPEEIINEFKYYDNGDILSVKDGNGNTTTYKYNIYGNLAEIARPLNAVHKAAYDKRSRLVSTTDPNNNTTTFTNDLIDRMRVITDAVGNSVNLVYDANNNAVSYTDRNKQQTKLMYDAADRLIAITSPLGNSSYKLYDAHDNLTIYIDDRGNSTKLFYDNLNRLTQVVNASNEIIAYGYYPNGSISNIVYPTGNNIQLKRDAINRITSISDNIGPVEQRQYDESGNMTTSINALEQTTKYVYDRQNRVVKKTDPMGNFEEYTYDKNFNQLSFIDKNGYAKHLTYDELNRIKNHTNALGAITTFRFDAAGNLTDISDANANTTHYTFDKLNRQINTFYETGSGNALMYDANGNITAFTDSKASTTHYSYDPTNRLVKINVPDSDDHTFTYDPNGNLLSAVNKHATANFAYDATNRLVTETLNEALTEYKYAISKGFMAIKYPSGREIIKHFDSRSRLMLITEANKRIFDAEYDLTNKIAVERHGNGEKINYNYDAGGRLLRKHSNSTPTIGYIYTYDKNNNKTSEHKIHNPEHSERYFYDIEGQLIEYKYGSFDSTNPARFQKFTYDKLGNRITATINNNLISYTTNALNQYTYVNGISQIFDPNGSVTDDGKNKYTYNSFNQLVQVNDTRLEYDALSRLVKVNNLADSIIYNYSFLNSIEIKKGVYNISNVFLNGLDNLVNIKVNGNNYYATHDNINSVTNLTDSSNNLIETYEYDPFGNVQIFNSNYSPLSSSDVGNDLQFAGRTNLTGTKLYNYRFRYLASENGRFIQKDPLEYIDGMNNLNYVNNNPLNRTDPLGLSNIVEDLGLCPKEKEDDNNNIMNRGRDDALNILTTGFEHYMYSDIFETRLGKNKWLTLLKNYGKDNPDWQKKQYQWAMKWADHFKLLGTGISAISVYKNMARYFEGKINRTEFLYCAGYELAGYIPFRIGNSVTAFNFGYSIGKLLLIVTPWLVNELGFSPYSP